MAGVERGNPIEAFQVYTQERIAHLTRLGVVLEEAMPVVTDLGLINDGLRKAGRAHLVMSAKAPMMPLLSPVGLNEKVNNFTAKFAFSFKEDPVEGRYGHMTYPRRPATRDELEIFRATGQSPEDWDSTHADKPAFQRLLALFPDFTFDLILARSQMERWRVPLIEPDMYVAYQIMSELVDPSDPYVLKKGEVDDWYLCR